LKAIGASKNDDRRNLQRGDDPVKGMASPSFAPGLSEPERLQRPRIENNEPERLQHPRSENGERERCNGRAARSANANDSGPPCGAKCGNATADTAAT
jgi:hypothetical protein